MNAHDLDRAARRLAALLSARRLTLATAESCTGGLVGAAVTAVPGSSDFYLGGVVSYANAAKVELLGVLPATLAAYGAVSAEMAVEMAAGARMRLQTDLAVSTTGIAGPGGGSPDKPVGLVFVAVASNSGVTAMCHHFEGDRETVRIGATLAALEALVAAVEGTGRQ